jgi:glucose/mannose-6-phosphate isomerase
MINYTQKLHEFDPTHQYQTLLQFPAHFKQGIDIGNEVDVSDIDADQIKNVVICGMGGSAIGADILKTYLMSELAIPVMVNRGYHLPAYVNNNSLIIAVSYSGNTEETLSSYDDAVLKGAQIAVITSGGRLTELAARHKDVLVNVPGGLAPRYALGYIFPPLLLLFVRLGLTSRRENDLKDTLRTIENAVHHYSDYEAKANDAVQIAEALHGMLPVIYSSQSALEAVNLRWRNQISENSKMLAFGNVFPEMNHNEIVGWEQNPELLQKIAVIALHERNAGPRIARRMNVTLGLIKPYAGHIIEIYADEERLLSRIFGLICLGDWISFYLATGTDTDPFPIEKINKLKDALADN